MEKQFILNTTGNTSTYVDKHLFDQWLPILHLFQILMRGQGYTGNWHR